MTRIQKFNFHLLLYEFLKEVQASNLPSGSTLNNNIWLMLQH